MYGLLAGSALVAAASGLAIAPRQTNDTSCPGYSASNVQQTGTGLSADLSLAGSPCNSYGNDIENLRLTVNYDTSMNKTIRHHCTSQLLTSLKTSDSTSRSKTALVSPTRCPPKSSLLRTQTTPSLQMMRTLTSHGKRAPSASK